MEERVRLTATTLRGIAHPLRMRLLGLLRDEGPSTATKLAERTGQSSGATSYHLRQLAAYGFVAEVPDQGTGRERWWQATHRSLSLEAHDAREAPEEAEAYMRSVAALYADVVDRWLGNMPAMPPEWDQAATLSDWRLKLTAEEAARLLEQMETLIRQYRRDDAEGPVPEGAEFVALQIQLMPFLGRAS
jgi:DNA-binding MarR family transcriptional regulator